MFLPVAGWLTALLSSHLLAADWPQWRGPLFNGATTETNLPVRWDRTNNVAWVAAMPGRSFATPIVSGDLVFTTSSDTTGDLWLLALDRRQGSVTWRAKLGTGDEQVGKNRMTAPSPATDGRLVVAFFATGDLAAFDRSGKELWRRDLSKDYGRFAYMWLYGGSPLLLDGRVYLQFLQRDVPTYKHAQDDKPARDSFLLCLDARSGKELWRQLRPTDAIEESHEGYATPTPVEVNGQIQVVLAGGNYVTGHAPDTGAELWRCGGLNLKTPKYGRTIPTPVAGAGMIFACGPQRERLVAIRAGGKGLVTGTHLAWQFTEFAPDVCTPLFYRDRLFALDGDRQTLTCLEPKTGEKLWQGRLPVREVFSASPTGADGRIYCLSENGTAVVLEAGHEFKVLETIEMDEGPTMASIAASHGHLFIRTAQNLYSIGPRE